METTGTNVVCDCCACNTRVADKTAEQLCEAGWHWVELRPWKTSRTHLGWCPSCVKRYDVEMIRPNFKKDTDSDKKVK